MSKQDNKYQWNWWKSLCFSDLEFAVFFGGLMLIVVGGTYLMNRARDHFHLWSLFN